MKGIFANRGITCCVPLFFSINAVSEPAVESIAIKSDSYKIIKNGKMFPRHSNFKQPFVSLQPTGNNICGIDESEQVWSNLPYPSYLLKNKRESNSLKITDMDDIGANVDGRHYVPVVFHVYGAHFNCETGNDCVTDEVILDSLNRTNEDFLGKNTHDGSILETFQNVRENLNIQFVLAKIDPEGNPTSGINRLPNNSGYGNYYPGGVKATAAQRAEKEAEITADSWDNYKYMNVYIMRDLAGDGVTNNSGVAWYPSTYDSNNGLARVVYNGNYIGSNSDENFRSILTHEFGHWLNLPHTFDDGCLTSNESLCSSTGDYSCDTPQVDNSNMGSNNVANCLGIPTNTDNFMNYSDNYAMYTEEQVDRMTAALHASSRETLWEDNNLIATGVAENIGIVEEPTGDLIFEVSNISASQGDSVNHQLTLPRGTESLAIYLDSATGNPDLYVSLNKEPEANAASVNTHYYSKNPIDLNERIDISLPLDGGIYQIKIHGNSEFSGARLRVYDVNDPTICESCERIVLLKENKLSANNGDTPLARNMTIPSDAETVKILIPAGFAPAVTGNSDPDLYVSKGTIPTTSVADCKPFSGPGLSETCAFTGNDIDGDYNLIIDPFISYNNVQLVGYYEHQKNSDNNPPSVNANGPYAATVNETVNFSSAGSNDSDGSISNYLWSFGDGQTSTVSNPSHQYTTAGSFNVSLTVTDDEGANATANTSAAISAADNELPVAIINGPYTGVIGELIAFSSDGSMDSDGTITSYLWDFNDGNTSDIASPNFAFASTGSYEVRLTVTDNSGATASVTTVATIESAPNVAPEAEINGPYNGNVNNSVSFSSEGSVDSDGSIASFFWQFGDTETSSEENPSHIYASVGVYTLTLTVTDEQGESHEVSTTVDIKAESIDDELEEVSSGGGGIGGISIFLIALLVSIRRRFNYVN